MNNSVWLWNGGGQNANPLHFNRAAFTPMARTTFIEELR